MFITIIYCLLVKAKSSEMVLERKCIGQSVYLEGKAMNFRFRCKTTVTFYSKLFNNCPEFNKDNL